MIEGMTNLRDDPLAHHQDAGLGTLIACLAGLDGPTDEAGVWSEPLWRALADSRVPHWSIPTEQGGEGLDRPALVRRNALLASGSLTAAFILTQHDAAVRRLAVAAKWGHVRAAEWLIRITAGESFCTVGLSQLTTSRRLGSRALVATPTSSGGYRLEGAMPWVTAAGRADVFVAGAVLDDDRQLLLLIPADRPGLEVARPMPLAALQASWTTEVGCRGVEVGPEEVLFGPSSDVLNGITPGSGTGGLETSALAIGLARAALDSLRDLAQERPDLAVASTALDSTWRELASDLIRAAEDRGVVPASIRGRSNDLALRSTQAYLAARKGSGFLRTEPAQRWARQALFFLVWSCPSPVVRAAIEDFAGLCPS